MTDPLKPPHPPRRRGIGVGEIIALGALVISGLGVWISWKNSGDDGPTRIVEQRQPIPLTLRASVEDDGKALRISPVEPGHALESMRITVPGVQAINVGSDGNLTARELGDALEVSEDRRKGDQSIRVTIDTRYVEAGADRQRSAAYVLRYRWEGGGLFGGRSLRLTGLSRGG